jgi:hypothetical protein
MVDFVVEVQNLPELRRALRDYPKISEPIFQKALAATAAVFAKYTQKNDPVPYRTGNLLMSFRHATGKLWARWYPTAKYAPFVEFGRGWVYPVNAKALSWEVVEGGGYRTATSGRRYHTGLTRTRVFAMYSRPSKPKPFMGKIAQKATPEINKLFVQALDMVNKEIAKRANLK